MDIGLQGRCFYNFKAIFFIRHSDESRNLVTFKRRWIPTFAGMTMLEAFWIK